MVDDSVREELATKITHLKIEKPPEKKPRGNSQVSKSSNNIKLKPPPKAIVTKATQTSEIKPNKTNPTLVEFQTKNARVPEWRLQMQNVAQQRIKQNEENTDTGRSPRRLRVGFTANGSSAAGTAVAVERSTEKESGQHLANALKRIELSRRKYHIETPDADLRVRASKAHSLSIASRTDFPTPVVNRPEAPVRPILVTRAVETQKGDYDTTELDPEVLPAKVSSSFGQDDETPKLLDEVREKPQETSDVTTETETAVEDPENEIETDEDIAPFGLRFNAGLFDLLIGLFLSLILLSPFMLIGGNWFTVAGFFGFLATCSLVMFIYLTTTIGLLGKTFGMHLFSMHIRRRHSVRWNEKSESGCRDCG